MAKPSCPVCFKVHAHDRRPAFRRDQGHRDAFVAWWCRRRSSYMVLFRGQYVGTIAEDNGGWRWSYLGRGLSSQTSKNTFVDAERAFRALTSTTRARSFV